MKSVSVRYFALLREEARIEKEELSISLGTYAELYEFLQKKHQFSLPVEMIHVAINDEFTRIENEIQDGARIVFIPPVAGG